MPSTIVQKMIGEIIILMRAMNRCPAGGRLLPTDGRDQSDDDAEQTTADDHRRCGGSKVAWFPPLFPYTFFSIFAQSVLTVFP